MKTVFLIIPSHIFTSDLLRTRYVKYLASKYRVVIITPFIDEVVARDRSYFWSPSMVYEKWLFELPKFWSIFKFLRISCVNEFDFLSSVRHFYKRPNYLANKKRRLLRILALPFKKILTADFFSRLEIFLLPISVQFNKLCSQYKPSLLITATPGLSPLEAELILLARKAKIPTVAVNFSWDNLTMNCEHIRKTNYLITWNSVMKKEAIDIHKYSPDKVFVSGTLRFDPYFTRDEKEPTREEFLKSKGLNPKYRTIFHTTVTKAYPFQKKYIRDLIKLRSSEKIPYVNLFIRIHPRDIYENYQDFFDVPDCYFEKAGCEFIDELGRVRVEMSHDDLLNLKYSLKYTDININYASTITIEACIFDKPIINIGYLSIYALAYDFTHYRPIYESGAVRLVKYDEDLPRLINMYLENPLLDSDKRKKIVEKYVEFTDGLSYKRSVDLLEQLTND